ncbi:MAG: protease-4 [Parasphingorhabdus sp.]|jgi:protease-4
MSDQNLETLIESALKEYRRHRRSKWILQAIFVLLVVGVLSIPFLDEYTYKTPEHTAIVDVFGVIGIGSDASAERINEGLRNAFKAEGVKGIVIRFNTPGGSPVQSSQINREIDRLQEAYPDIPVYAVVDEICASGGYYVAVAADKIFVDQASIVGSIGVRMDSFGFVDAMKSLGIERRLFTAGNNKGILDPFLPLENFDEGFATNMLNQVHNQFIDAVKQGRGDRLVDDKEIFSGLFWIGEQAKNMGLVDDFGSVDSVAREIIGTEVTINYTPGNELLDRIGKEFGASVMSRLIELTGLNSIRMH